MNEVLGDILRMIQVKDTEDNRDHLRVLLKAFMIYSAREEKYHGGWRSLGWLGNVSDLLRKAARARAMFWIGSHVPMEITQDMMPNDDDPAQDLFDAINYAAFTVRNANAGNRTG